MLSLPVPLVFAGQCWLPYSMHHPDGLPTCLPLLHVQAYVYRFYSTTQHSGIEDMTLQFKHGEQATQAALDPICHHHRYAAVAAHNTSHGQLSPSTPSSRLVLLQMSTPPICRRLGTTLLLSQAPPTAGSAG